MKERVWEVRSLSEVRLRCTAFDPKLFDLELPDPGEGVVDYYFLFGSALSKGGIGRMRLLHSLG